MNELKPEIMELLTLVGKKYARNLLTTTDFDEFSLHLKSEHGYLISTSTLKRLWGYVNDTHQPRTQTLDVLSQLTNNEVGMNKSIEKYIGVGKLSSIPIKQALIFQKIYDIYHGVGKDDIVLLTAIDVYKRLYPKICGLSHEQQLDIIHESTMIAYDARTKAFEHMINYNPNNE